MFWSAPNKLFNQTLKKVAHDIVVLVQQDIYLPWGWDTEFARGFEQAREHFGPLDHRNPEPLGFDDLRVRPLDGGRDNDDVGSADVGRRVPLRYADAQLLLQPRRHQRSLRVRPADLEPEVGEQFGNAAHPDAADADEVHAAGSPERQMFHVPGSRFPVPEFRVRIVTAPSPAADRR